MGINHAARLLRLAATCVFITVAACSTSTERIASATQREADAGGAPTDATRGELLRDSALFLNARGRDTRCTVPPGPVVVRAFVHARYAVAWSTPLNCGGTRVTSGWVSAADVDYQDAALAPLMPVTKFSATNLPAKLPNRCTAKIDAILHPPPRWLCKVQQRPSRAAICRCACCFSTATGRLMCKLKCSSA